MTVILTGCPQKAPLCSICSTGWQLYPAGCEQDTGKLPFFSSDSIHDRNFRNVSRQQSRLWVCHQQHGVPLYITGHMVHFRYYKKWSPHRLAWSSPCTDRGEIEPTSVFRATTDPRQISSRSVDMWENGGQKEPFFDLEDSHGYRCAWPSKLNCLFIHSFTYLQY